MTPKPRRFQATSVGTAAALQPQDMIWPQYRELGAFLWRGLTAQELPSKLKSKEGKAKSWGLSLSKLLFNPSPKSIPTTKTDPNICGYGRGMEQGMTMYPTTSELVGCMFLFGQPPFGWFMLGNQIGNRWIMAHQLGPINH